MNRLIFSIICLSFINSPLRSQPSPPVSSLAQIAGVRVMVSVDSLLILQNLGITQDRIQTSIELRLRSLGLKVIGNNEFRKSATVHNGLLSFEIGVLQVGQDATYCYSIVVTFYQDVLLLRSVHHDTPMFATTWQDHSMGVLGENKLSKLLDNIMSHLDKFANDYLSVNQK